MNQMTHRERLTAALSSRAAVDQPAISLWRHFGGIDMTAEGLSSAMLGFQAAFDFDFVKFMPTGTYSIIDWGAKTVWEPNDHGIRTVRSLPIHAPVDWERLPRLDTGTGVLGMVNDALARTTAALGRDVPVLQTIFSPLTTARKLGGAAALAHMRQAPDAFAAGMATIEGVTHALIEDALHRGADLFYVFQSASGDILTAPEVERWELAYARRLLGDLPSETVVLLHTHGDHLWFREVADLPVDGINWHDQTSGPTLKDARAVTDKGLVGGIDAWSLLRSGTPPDVEQAVDRALGSLPSGVVLAPGCVIPTDSAPHLISAARQAAASYPSRVRAE
jgi:uroporphyrinogen decarboxylase